MVMAGRMAVTPGNKNVYTYLRINLHMLNEVILCCFFPLSFSTSGRFQYTHFEIGLR